MRIPPRETPTRAEKYMGLAFIISGFSKDPNTQHGAVIVTEDNEPLGMGYNGPPKQFNDDDVDWCRKGDLTKYDVTDHSERNAIDHSKEEKLPGSIMYVTGKPCHRCMKDIIKNGIKKVVYYEDKDHHDPGSMCVSKEMGKTDMLAEKGGVILEPFQGNLTWLDNWNAHLGDLGIYKVW
jgi:dCMP deaminase